MYTEPKFWDPNTVCVVAGLVDGLQRQHLAELPDSSSSTRAAYAVLPGLNAHDVVTISFAQLHDVAAQAEKASAVLETLKNRM